jgi:chromosome segregation ATPase
LASSYVNEIEMLKSKMKNEKTDSFANLKKELENLRSNEKEYQNFIYQKTKELFDLTNRFNLIEIENGLIQQYKFKYDELQSEYIAICSSLNELKTKNLEFKNLIQSQKSIKNLEDLQLQTARKVERLLDHFQSTKNEPSLGNDFGNLITTVENMKFSLNSLISAVNEVQDLKDKLSLLFKYLSNEVSNNMIKTQTEFSDQLVSPENEILKKENEILKSKCNSVVLDLDVLIENDNLKRDIDQILFQNDKLKSENDLLKNENQKIKGDNDAKDNKIRTLESTVSDLKRECKSFKKDSTENKQKVEELLIKIDHLENEQRSNEEKERLNEQKLNEGSFDRSYDRDDERSDQKMKYVIDLENELDFYKKDIKSIENQFTEYKKLYESFNIQSSDENISIMKENINRKNVLIDSLYSLVDKYRKATSILS